MHLLLLLVVLAMPFCSLFAQTPAPWIGMPKDQWPHIGLINKVVYKNGNQYIDPSFAYAGTGFLIRYQNDTFAATAKHVLWIARNRNSATVQVNDALQKWVMGVKGNAKDSAVIEKLLNEDSTEILEGPQSTITERDAVFFSVSRTTPGIYPLTPRFTKVRTGEKVYFISSDYADSVASVYEGTVLRQLGNDILVERDMTTFRGGASGSPIIDSNGHVIAVTSIAAADPRTGKGVAVGISMAYFQDVLEHTPGFNKPKKDYGALIYKIVKKSGVNKAIQKYHSLVNNPDNYYTYNLHSSNRNGLLETGQKLLNEKRYPEAISILQLNVAEHPAYYINHNELAKAYLMSGNTRAAVRQYQLSIQVFNDTTENEAFRELKKLGVYN